MDNFHITILQIEPRPELSCAILSKINTIKNARYRRDRLLFGALTTLSVIAVVPATVLTVQSFVDSNFVSYGSLIASDTATILFFWKELGLSLIESIPVGSVAVTTSLFAIALWSMRHIPIRTTTSYHTSNA